MTQIHWATVLSAAVLASPNGAFRVENPQNAEKSPAEEGNVKALQHETTVLHGSPPVHFKKRFSLEGKDMPGSSIVIFSPDARLLAVALRGGYVDPKKADLALWDVQKRKLLRLLPHPEMHITGIAFFPPGPESRII